MEADQPRCSASQAPARDPDDMFSITYMPAETEILLDDFGSGPAIDINGDADPDFGADDFQHKAMAGAFWGARGRGWRLVCARIGGGGTLIFVVKKALPDAWGNMVRNHSPSNRDYHRHRRRPHRRSELASKYNISLDSGRRCCCECERADASCEKALPLYLTVVGLVVILGFTIAFYAWRNVI